MFLFGNVTARYNSRPVFVQPTCQVVAIQQEPPLDEPVPSVFVGNTWMFDLPVSVQRDISYLWSHHGKCLDAGSGYAQWVNSLLLRVLRGFTMDYSLLLTTGVKSPRPTWCSNLPPLVKQIFASFLIFAKKNVIRVEVDPITRHLRILKGLGDVTVLSDTVLAPLEMLKYLVPVDHIEKKLQRWDRARGTPADWFFKYGGKFADCCCGECCWSAPVPVAVTQPCSDTSFFLGDSVAVSPQPEDEGEASTGQDEGKKKEDTARLVAPFLPAIITFEDPLVLDFGSGKSRFSEAVNEHLPGVRVLDYDPDPGSLSPLSGLKITDLQVTADVVVMNQVLHHVRVKKPPDFFRKVTRLMRPGSVLAVREDIWDERVGSHESMDRLHGKFGRTKVRYLTRARLISLAAAANLYYVPSIEPTDFPVLRSNRIAQVFFFIFDSSKDLTSLMKYSKLLTAAYGYLRGVVSDHRQQPTRVVEMINKASRQKKFAYPIIDYLREHQQPPVVRIAYAQPFAVSRMYTSLTDIRDFVILCFYDLLKTNPQPTRENIATHALTFGNPVPARRNILTTLDALVAEDHIAIVNNYHVPGLNWFAAYKRATNK